MGKRKIELKLITDKKVRYVRKLNQAIVDFVQDLLQQEEAWAHQEGHGAGDVD